MSNFAHSQVHVITFLRDVQVSQFTVKAAEITSAVFYSVCYIFPLYCHRKEILEKICQ